MKKAKGVKKNVVKKVIKHQGYVDCLFEERKFMHTRVCYHLNINSMPSIRVKSPLAITMINDTCWMMGLTLCLTTIIVCLKF